MIGNRATDDTPQQDSLSGVIICPAKRMEGQRLRVNSVTAILTAVHTQHRLFVKELELGVMGSSEFSPVVDGDRPTGFALDA